MAWRFGILVVAMVACSSNSKTDKPKEFLDAELALDALASGPLDSVIDKLDIDGDGVAGQDDIRDIEECIAQQNVALCALDGNGVADDDDLILAKLWIGYRVPRPAEVVAQLTDGLDLFALPWQTSSMRLTSANRRP